MESILSLSAPQIVEQIAAGKLTSEQVVSFYYQRAQKINEKWNAIVEFNTNAIEEAKALDKYFAETGKLKGRFHGVPVTIKEHVGVKGFKCTFAFKPTANNIAPEDSTVYKRLKEEGAVLIGTTNMPELGMSYETSNEIYGTTKNPHNADFIPGGSSGGEGAALASRMSVVGIGSDIGGSIRIPAALTGVVGLRPSQGAVSLAGVGPADFSEQGIILRMATFGPMATSVDDVELAFDAVHGYDGADWETGPRYYKYGDANKVDVSKLKVAYFANGEVDSDVGGALERTAQILQKNGVQVVKHEPAIFKEGYDLWMRLLGIYVASFKQIAPEATCSPQLKQFYTTMANYEQKTAEDIKLALLNWDQFRRKFVQIFKEYDALITPVTAKAGYLHTDPKEFEEIRHTLIISVVGLPTLSIGGVVEAKGEGKQGLPVGVQIIGNLYREDVVFSLGKLVDKERELKRPKELESAVSP